MADAGNPFETPSPRGMRLVQGTLRVVVALQCFAMGATVLHRQQNLPLAELLKATYSLPADQVAHGQSIGAWLLLGVGALTLLRPTWLLLLPVSVAILGNLLAPAIIDNGATAWLEALRFTTAGIAPIALLLVDFWPPKIKPTLVLSLSALGLLRLATCISSLATGAVCLWDSRWNGPLVEFTQKVAARCGRENFSQDAAQQALLMAAAISIALAISLITARLRSVALLLAMWGGALAATHTLVDGVAGYPLTLARAADVGAPLCLLQFWILAIRERPPEYLAERE